MSPAFALLALAPAAAPEAVRYDWGPGDTPRHAPADLDLEPPAHAAGLPHVLYVNFDGVTIEGGAWQDDATANQTVFPDFGGEWPPFGEAPGGPIREAVLAALRVDFDGFGLEITDERPSEGLYTMVVVSPRNAGGSTLGVANVVCGGGNRAGIAFAFFGAAGGDVTKIAATIAHEGGHSLGLDHVMETADLMFPTNQGGDPSFVDACVPLDADALCTNMHALHCPTGQQNSVAELGGLLGTGEVDHEGPALEIVAPGDGDRFAIGEIVDVEVDATDDVGVQQVKLYRSDELVGTDVGAPYGWSLDELDEGVYELRAVGLDAAGNEAESAVVTFAVGDAELPSGEDSGSEGGSDSGDGDAIDTFGEPRGEHSCGCTSEAPRGAWALALLVVGAARRRRSR
jgi:MYXO-CTERM domain-containing protein